MTTAHRRHLSLLRRSAVNGFTSEGRSAVNGFTIEGRSAVNGFTSEGRSAVNGFTLVEMLVALLIFGILAAAGVALLSFSVRAQHATATKLDDVAALDRLSSALAADLAQATTRSSRDEAGAMSPAFVGESGSTVSPMIRLVRRGWSNLDQTPRAGLQKVEYRLTDGILERVGYPMLDGAAPFDPAPMLTHVRQVALAYRLDGAWTDHWQPSARAPLPQALELRLVRDDGLNYRELFLVGTGYGERPIDAAH